MSKPIDNALFVAVIVIPCSLDAVEEKLLFS